MIDHYRKLIFIHIARTGGTSVEAALVGRDWWEVDPATKHLSASQTRRLYGEDLWNTYLKFAVVRNPWDRLVSMWATGWWHPDEDPTRITDFGQFLDQLQPHPNEHYRSLLYRDILDEPVDRVLRFERLSDDFARLMTDLGQGGVQLPHHERRERGDYRRYYDDDLRDRVGRRFADDIREFDYTF